jgi:hypothetical protein
MQPGSAEQAQVRWLQGGTPAIQEEPSGLGTRFEKMPDTQIKEGR